ncbi:cysteine desulfurase [Alicyclobacillus fastidiosus]|uniref:cysteine desulfurase n=1 Tax=Alicyclobacillus fastidiosus TaxID=392011 RepID=A0ABY6ZNS8_9BACL|nr:cysteine desulfurase family protein [Alicyclobacillus fastidiosus]WAH43751.1 cysteine desulfurase [Alicyclobacillus fastidiosus]GMA59969.1 putative cysteine desulfurase IscS 1 [Alicyclobacillus fastidiosus]
MIYLDNAATTKVSDEVRAAMMPYLEGAYGNPSSIHQAGRKARQAVDHARRHIASWLGCDARDLVFTSGGTEANATALTGAYVARRETKRHIITSAVEHHAVLHTLEFLESVGAEVTILPVDGDGRVRVEDVLAALREDTGVVSIMAVNNEIGTIEPIERVVQAVKSVNPSIVVHSDMVQALPFIAHPLLRMPVDMATFSAHKIHGPKGIGLLYLRKDVPWRPMLYGGQQEGRRRGGTENVAGIVGFGAAVDALSSDFERRVAHIGDLQRAFFDVLQRRCNAVLLSPEDGAPTILSVAFPGVRNDTLLMRLDLAGVAASAGSACTAGSLEPSHVIAATGRTEYLGEAVRFSFSDDLSMDHILEAAEIVCTTVEALTAGARFS